MSQKGRNRATSKRHASVFAALGDETRLFLVTKLCGGQPRSISQLTAGTKLIGQAITKHVRVMEWVGIVDIVRDQRERFLVTFRATS